MTEVKRRATILLLAALLAVATAFVASATFVAHGAHAEPTVGTGWERQD
jgi:hypothetical protein